MSQFFFLQTSGGLTSAAKTPLLGIHLIFQPFPESKLLTLPHLDCQTLNLLWIRLKGTFAFWVGSVATERCQSKEGCLKGMDSHDTNLMPRHSSILNKS